MWRTGILLLAACANPPKQAFVVDGFVDVSTDPAASVVGIWELAGSPPKYYKLGDGVRLNTQFTLGFDTDPPPEALNPDGIGVAFVVMLPELTTVPDGPVNVAALGQLGISADTAVVYKASGATGPAWAQALPPRFSCVQCQRNGASLDTFALTPCAGVIVEAVGSPLCNWF